MSFEFGNKLHKLTHKYRRKPKRHIGGNNLTCRAKRMCLFFRSCMTYIAFVRLSDGIVPLEIFSFTLTVKSCKFSHMSPTRSH